MIPDPGQSGRALARLLAEVAPRMFHDLEESGLLPPASRHEDRERARREWECFALYACVRGLVAAGGFNRETAQAIDALHEAALDPWRADEHGGETEAERRRILSARHAEYGAIGQEGGASGAATVTRRLGEAAARHMTGLEPPSAELAETVGALHEALAEGAAEAVRRGEPR